MATITRTALASAQITAGTSKVLTVSGIIKGQLLFASIAVNATAPAPVVTDNSGRADTNQGWVQIGTVQQAGAAAFRAALFYKVTNATDVAALTQITYSWTGAATVGSCAASQATGFVGIPTLDIFGQAGAATASNTASKAQNSSVANVFAFSIEGSSALGTVSTPSQYSPDGGTTGYAFSTATATGSHLNEAWANATSSGTNSQWEWTWSGAVNSAIIGATFYDQVNSGDMLTLI